jgi:eukaryotic-like serine/threonine-protein kinase
LIEQRETAQVAYVMDFGLALESHTPSLTMSGLVVGTPSYMSPEQVREERDKLDARTDIYSIGATLYEAITGALRFKVRTARKF